MKKTWFNSQRRESFLIFFISLFIYSLCAYGRLGRASSNNHFSYLAQSFLAGQSNLITKPPHGNDWASYEKLSLNEAAQRRLSLQLGRTITELKGIYTPKVSNQHQASGRNNRSQAFRTLKGEYVNIKRHDVLKRSRLYYVSFPPFPAFILMPFVAIFGLATSDVWLTLFFAALNVLVAYSNFKFILEEIDLQQRKNNENTTQSRTNRSKQSVKSNALWLAIEKYKFP